MSSNIKIFKLLLLTIVVLFTFSCGDDDSLKAKDVAGTWKIANGEPKSNSCELSDGLIDELTEDFSFYKIKDNKEKVSILACEKSSCTENVELGEYTFKETMNTNKSITMDLATLFELSDLDCKIKSEFENKFMFSDKNNANLKFKMSITKMGNDCDSLKDLLEQSDDEQIKEFIKVLSNSSCDVSLSGKIQKQ